MNNICLFEFKIVYCFAFGKIVKIIVDILTRFLNYCKVFTEEPKTWSPLDQLGSYRLRKFTFAKTKINLLLVNLNQEATIKPKLKVCFYEVIQKYT